ncbi:hypothetical protein DRQ07_05900 [candidate division KSB1 bacterium]|nr:MAG: hypothetical protein DRQ07_05900 [candidate division KSB1 bacterium]
MDIMDIEIKVNKENETISAYAYSSVEKISENTEFQYTTIHKECNNLMDLINVSDTHNALICRRCLLRILIPNKLKTWKDLIEHYKSCMF